MVCDGHFLYKLYIDFLLSLRWLYWTKATLDYRILTNQITNTFFGVFFSLFRLMKIITHNIVFNTHRVHIIYNICIGKCIYNLSITPVSSSTKNRLIIFLISNFINFTIAKVYYIYQTIYYSYT